MLAERGKDGSLKNAARYRLNKQAKAIFQVGAARSDGWATTLGYPAELVPLENPYKMKPGATLGFKCLVDGKVDYESKWATITFEVR